MFHAQYTRIPFFEDVFKYTVIIDLSRARFFTSGVIAQMKGRNFRPGCIHIGNDVSFSNLLVIHIIYNLARRTIDCTAYCIGLRNSRKEKPGMITFHPQGIHHGPQPQAAAASKTKERTDEQAVMIDTRRPLHITDAAKRASQPDYWRSWGAKEQTR